MNFDRFLTTCFDVFKDLTLQSLGWMNLNVSVITDTRSHEQLLLTLMCTRQEAEGNKHTWMAMSPAVAFKANCRKKLSSLKRNTSWKTRPSGHQRRQGVGLRATVTRGWGHAHRDHRAPGQHRGCSGKGLPLLPPVLHVPSCSFKGTNICMLAKSSFSNPTKTLTLGRSEC